MVVKVTLLIAPQTLSLPRGSTLSHSEVLVCIARVSERLGLQVDLKVTLRIPPGKRTSKKPVIASVRVWLLSWYIVYPGGWVGCAVNTRVKKEKATEVWL